MNDYFVRLFQFNNWANKIVCNFLIQNQIDDSDCISLMSHLLLAQSNWYKRIIGEQNDQPVWNIIELPELLKQLEENGIVWLDYVRTLDPGHFGKSMDYHNMAGQPFRNSIQDTLVHVVNHATYHRGQIILRIRESGFVPPSTDYIQFARIFPDN